jgi:transcription elongation GreA/GreB family factor
MEGQKKLKKELFQFCEIFVSNKIETIKANLSNIQEALTSETKSSAGDKHETGRAMLQIEREKLGERLKVAEEMGNTLFSINQGEESIRIGLGSLVFTSNNNFYIAIPSGLYSNQVEKVYCISLQSPIGNLLFGKAKGDFFEFNGKRVDILSVE